MYSTASEAIRAQRMSSPLDDEISRVTRPRRRRSLSTTFRPSVNRGGQL
ncbi:MAG TPA: hypothetical protein VKY71_07255 [Actinotalea caeni]|nr:hypothetical protein [Actinotalea caeni]HLV55348.1 hypothetical protein [Actinotalea caeni]